MFTTFFFLSLVLSLLRTVFAQSDFTIDTPEMIQVRPPVFRIVRCPMFLVPIDPNHLE